MSPFGARPLRKTILITGASSGLGMGMAREFAARGRDLALCARRVDRLEGLRAELLAANSSIRVAIRPLDVTRYDDVPRVFRAFRDELGSLDRVVVNAGVGKGSPVGTGRFAHDRVIAETNFVAALAQCDAAVEIFREAGAGHLVTIASMSALRGLPRHMTAYGATKAGLAALTEGIRAELRATPIRVTTIFPGYVRTGNNPRNETKPFVVDLDVGCRAIVRAVEREVAEAYVPAWPWALLGFAMKRAPLSLLARLA